MKISDAGKLPAFYETPMVSLMLAWLRRWPGELLALLAGCAMPLGFAPFSWCVVTVISPSVLYLLGASTSTRRAALRGLLFGAGMFGCGVYWVFTSFHQFGHLHFAAASLLTALFVLLLAAFPALLMFAIHRLLANSHLLSAAVAFAAGWALLDWVRSWLFTGFPWLALGYAHTDSALAGFASVAGVFGTSFVTVLLSALLANAVTRRIKTVWINLAAIALIVVIGAVLSRVEWTHPTGDTLAVALVQGNIEQDKKWLSSSLLDTLDLYMELVESSLDADVVVLPETAIPENLSRVPDFTEAIDVFAKQQQATVLVGVPIDRNGKFYNGVKAYGQTHGEYLKRHLVPFGEYMPWRQQIPALKNILDAPMSNFSPGGNRQPVLTPGGRPAGLSICYEDVFANTMFSALPEAEWLINISNDGWFGNSVAPHQHLQITRLRAIESGRYIARATNTGISAIIDHHGEVLASTPQFTRTVLKGEVALRQGATLYITLGDTPVIIALALLFFGSYLSVARRSSSR